MYYAVASLTKALNPGFFEKSELELSIEPAVTAVVLKKGDCEMAKKPPSNHRFVPKHNP